MTLTLSLQWWMAVPAVLTVLYGLVLAFLVRDRAIEDTWQPVTLFWAVGMVISLVTRWLP